VQVLSGCEATKRGLTRYFGRLPHHVGSRRNRLLTTTSTLAVVAALGGCGAASASSAALSSALAHPDGPAAARYVSITLGDLPHGYRADRPSSAASALDASETLAEYRCENLDPSTDPPSLSTRSPVFTSPTGSTELYETTAVFGTAQGATARLSLELSSRYPSCKAAAVRRALLAAPPRGADVGAVAVHVSALSSHSGDRGVEVQGVIPMTLAGGVSALAISDSILLVRGRFVAELTVETTVGSPSALVDRLTDDIAGRLAQVEPNRH
jgi:hypothetical protein